MKYVIPLLILIAPLMGAECSSPDGSYHESYSNGNVAPVPEPSSALIFGTSLVLIGAYMQIRKVK